MSAARPACGGEASQSYAAWQKAGVARADGQPFPLPNATAKLWVPVRGGPAFLLGPNFYAVRSYNPSMNYTLSIVHLGDRVMGGEPFVQKFPGSERAPTLAEVQEIQTPAHRARLRHRRRRRPRRQLNHERGAKFPEQDRHAADGRLCRGHAAREAARGEVIGSATAGSGREGGDKPLRIIGADAPNVAGLETKLDRAEP